MEKKLNRPRAYTYIHGVSPIFVAPAEKNQAVSNVIDRHLFRDSRRCRGETATRSLHVTVFSLCFFVGYFFLRCSRVRAVHPDRRRLFFHVAHLRKNLDCSQLSKFVRNSACFSEFWKRRNTFRFSSQTGIAHVRMCSRTTGGCRCRMVKQALHYFHGYLTRPNKQRHSDLVLAAPDGGCTSLLSGRRERSDVDDTFF
jgi:hypothetical protein